MFTIQKRVEVRVMLKQANWETANWGGGNIEALRSLRHTTDGTNDPTFPVVDATTTKVGYALDMGKFEDTVGRIGLQIRDVLEQWLIAMTPLPTTRPADRRR